MSLADLNARVRHDLATLNIGAFAEPSDGIYDVIIVGGGQSGLGAAFGLLRERVSQVLVLDENPAGYEGPWETYARMVTLRTPKHLTAIDFAMPSLTFRAFWEAQHGSEGWEAIDKIPRGDWMAYLRWYREILNIPLRNDTRVDLVEPADGLYVVRAGTQRFKARKVVLATGIQGGGEWHVPPLIADALPPHLYAHTSQPIDFAALQGKRIAILGGGASAFDNAHHALTEGVAEAHVFVRRNTLPTVNPIRHMEAAGFIARFPALNDADKYAVMSSFFQRNQPPTNDTFARAAAMPGFHLHLGAPWHAVEHTGDGATVTTLQGRHDFDFLIVSTGLITDPALRLELRLVESGIRRWKDVYAAPDDIANDLIDNHPYLSPGFAFTGRTPSDEAKLRGLYAFNYSALISCGLSASALSGLKYALPKLASGIADDLFRDDSAGKLAAYYAYDEPEFTGVAS
ncbi:monooxygenase [Asticcacaulis sp. AC460]|uniref:NAD(P)-binding domain-containing protein n=1 Tax=Asticcacaulis sp. AC460 TaxID=1282360 RepID=UPI0003C3DD4A|nr:NAD(P)-binding domain-containing protein [Asticcacaulis sp. AC460]ESQ91240.1 monooxygenase [Asticcacaulis sp. AC460]